MVRSARTLRSMAALVSVVVERRAPRQRQRLWAVGGPAPGVRRWRPRAVLVRRLAGLERGAPRHAVGTNTLKKNRWFIL